MVFDARFRALTVSQSGNDRLSRSRRSKTVIMTAVPFDTLKFANSLKAAGVPDKQAEAEVGLGIRLLFVRTA